MIIIQFFRSFSFTMRIVLQKVLSASVSVNGKKISEIGKGIMCLVGLRDNDDLACSEVLAKKILVFVIQRYYLLGCTSLG